MEVVTGEQLKLFFEGGLEALRQHQQEIDQLNVYPVPDGDTGKNLFLTMVSAVKELQRVNSLTISNVSEAAAKGSLLGARGNSGVILSQLIRGFAEAVRGKETISGRDFARAWQTAVAVAYRAVIKPVEGTMLTVAREFARSLSNAVVSEEDLCSAIAKALKDGYEILQKTPDMLPVLKKAGVVDAGGKGLLVMLEGGLRALRESGGFRYDPWKAEKFDSKEGEVKQLLSPEREEDFSHLYCVSLTVETDVSNAGRIREEVAPLGDSLVIGGASDVVKLHIHTNFPGKILECCQKYGTLHNIEIANMRDQWEERLQFEKASCEEEKPDIRQSRIGIVAVAAGEGIKNLFKSLGVNEIIEGGQTMNPSVEEFVNSIEKVDAQEVIILPNNKNLILAAEQAKSLVSKRVEIVPSVTIPGGLAAMLAFNENLDIAENKERMVQALDQVKVGEVTYVVRDASFDGVQMRKGDYVGFYEGRVVTSGSSLEDVVCDLVDHMISPQDELVTLYAGAQVSPSESEKILKRIQEAHPEIEIESHFGGQPVYYYLISVE
ncbi:MAG: DAK2 domain-containing protein [Thermacetogeniaceae bacterium]